MELFNLSYIPQSIVSETSWRRTKSQYNGANVPCISVDAERRLGFLDKEGFDRFGNNKLFAPLMKWERLKENAEDIEKYAKEYQDAFNRIQRSIRQQEDITDILKDLAPKAARIQVSNQIKRLKTARAVDESEKRLYVEVRWWFVKLTF